jgi:hypothetical protein
MSPNRCSNGSAVADILIGTAIILLVILPVFSAVVEKYIVNNKIQIIKDAVDMTNISAYNAISTASLGQNQVHFDENEVEAIYRTLLAENLNLKDDLSPEQNSLADDKVIIDSINVYTDGMPLTCPNGTAIERPTVHSVVIVPVKPDLYRGVILKLMRKQHIEFIIHVDSEIPVNN